MKSSSYPFAAGHCMRSQEISSSLPLPSHFREYAKHDWSIYRTDWYDRLSAPLTAYYDEDEIIYWLSEESLENVQISSYKDFFIRGIGTKL